MVRARPLGERLFAMLRVEPETGCLVWIGALTDGYGYISIGGKRSLKVRAHRAAYEIVRGPIPEGLVIDHLCRNRRCCNVDHLEAVTDRENIERGEAGHLFWREVTHCKHGHEFTPENTRYRLNGWRDCLRCDEIRGLARNVQRRAESIRRRQGAERAGSREDHDNPHSDGGRG